MDISPVSFFFFGAVALAGGVNMIVQRNPVHGALWLICSFLGIAGLFLTLDSGFLAAVQATVYAGAIMVLFLFVILLLNLETKPFEGVSTARVAAGVAALTTVSLILFPFLESRELRTLPTPLRDAPASPANVSQYLFKDYVLPFEIVSLLLLVSMVGSIYLAQKVRTSNRPSNRR